MGGRGDGGEGERVLDLEPSPTEGLLTAWGGVFYLIHLLDELDRPGALSEEVEVPEDLHPWARLDLVARGLLAHRWSEIAGDPVWQVLGELAGRKEEAPDDLRLHPWLPRALPALRRRLLLALGDAEAEGGVDPPDRDLIERLLAVPARLHVTSTHLDLVADLDAIWLPARAAGLDRDPGWRPDYGRVVLFHFV